MITIYAPEAQDFSTLGLGALAPYECVIEEQAGGMYELTMTHPMDAEGKWLNIGVAASSRPPRRCGRRRWWNRRSWARARSRSR